MKSPAKKKWVDLFILYLPMVVIMIFILFPFYWTLVTAFKREADGGSHRKQDKEGKLRFNICRLRRHLIILQSPGKTLVSQFFSVIVL